MLGTKIQLAEKYNYLEEKFLLGYAFLRKKNLAELEVGAYELGQGVVANIQHYTTVSSETVKFETHDRFFDIQFVISGQENFEVANRADLEASTEYDAEKDMTFYKDPQEKSVLLLKAGDFVAVAPEDAHKPRCNAGGSNAVKKVVVKVPV